MKKPHHILSSGAYRGRATAFSLIALGLVGSSIIMGFDPATLFTDFHYATELFGSMTPPNLRILWTDKSIGMAILETLSMAFLGTLFGVSIGLLLAFLAASDTNPAYLLRLLVRFFLAFLRVLPPLFTILVFVVAVGLGPFAGMLTLIVYIAGTFGQLFTDIIENRDKAPADAVYSIGASRGQVIRYVIIPQVLPSFTANFFYAFDTNIRAAIGLGIFGGGGIGFQLFQAMRVLHYKDAMTLILLTVLLIFSTERISDAIRSRLLATGPLK
jgi:phosphonate transport system permease protein